MQGGRRTFSRKLTKRFRAKKLCLVWLSRELPKLPKTSLTFMSRHTYIPKTVACFLLFTEVSATAGDLPSNWIPQISPLKEYRPIGASGNNLKNPRLNPVPGTPETALTPLNFAGPHNQPVSGPNARYISNQVSGGTGANGQDSQTTDPTASAWIYVFGQILDHDIDLEATPLTNDAINIRVPPGDLIFPAGGTIAMNRSTRSPVTNTIINTTAGYLDLSQLYGSDAVTA